MKIFNNKPAENIEDIDFNNIKFKEAMLIIETLHKMSYNIPNDMALGEEVRSFFNKIDLSINE